MQRRDFITRTSLSTFGLLCSGSLIRCTTKTIALAEVIGLEEKIMHPFVKTGNTTFGYYTLSKGTFSYPTLKVDEAFVYSSHQYITGISLLLSKTEDFESLKEKLSTAYGEATLCYENAYGKAYRWTTPKRQFVVTAASGRRNTPKLITYSEAIPASQFLSF